MLFFILFLPIIAFISLIAHFLSHKKLKNLSSKSDQYSFAIIGAGFSGILTAIKLQKMGLKNFKIFDYRNEIGGTWTANQYPGCECDVMSHLYSFSFELNPNWERPYPKQEDILQYIKKIAAKYQIYKYTQLNTKVIETKYNEKTKKWTVKSQNLQNNQISEYTCNFIISGQGALNTPYTPEFKGKNKFQGEQMHSAQFNTNYDFTNKKVAIVGSAASAIQLAPIIAKQVKDLYIVQRTPNYIIDKEEKPYSKFQKLLFKYCPFYLRLYRNFLFFIYETNYAMNFKFLRKSLKKKFQKQIISETKFLPPSEQKKLIPQYDVGCKRVLKSNHYLPMFKNKNVHLIDEKIQEFTENSIIFQQQNSQNNQNLNEIQIDTVIFATGFVLADVQFEVIGKNNLTLKQYWNKFPKAYKSAFIPNFPNLILLLGPNSGLGHSSMIFMLESQMHYVTQLLEQIISEEKQEIEIKEEVLENELNHHNKKAKNSIWLQGNCSSWYKNESGQLFTLFVGFCTEFWWKMRKINLSEFKII